MAKRVLTPEQKAWYSAIGKFKRTMQKAEQWDNVKHMWNKRELERTLAEMREFNKGKAVAGLTPLMIVQEQNNKFDKVMEFAETNTLGLTKQNYLKTFYELSDSTTYYTDEDEKTYKLMDRKYNEETKLYEGYALYGGAIKRYEMSINENGVENFNLYDNEVAYYKEREGK